MNAYLSVLVVLLALSAYSAADGRQRGSRQSRRWTAWVPRQNSNSRRISQPNGGRHRRMGVSLTGPNVCHEKGSTFCCPGWTTTGNGKMCTRALCEEGRCGRGVCRSPNVCLCMDGRTAPSCPLEKPDDRKCAMRCMHGGECINNECRCAFGYTGPYCEQPICGPGCLNGGRCISPGRCACVYGFTGMRCERDYRKGPCFLTRANNTCVDEVPSVMCTKLFCCATVGQGWGHPCEECPARVGNCSKGRLPPHCQDINECEIMRGLCEGGECKNTDGSFTCVCPEGFEYNSKAQACVDKNECDLGVCSGGTCINNEGGFLCECPKDYLLSQDGTYCIPDFPGRCYTAIESGMCATPLSSLVRRTKCCCVVSGQETLGKCFAAVGPDHHPERCAAIGTPEFERSCGTGTTDWTDRETLCFLLGEQACPNGQCVDVLEQKSYTCQCNVGYQLSENGKKCVDVNECLVANGGHSQICGKEGTCLNTEGSYTCRCHKGFENQGALTSCTDIDECAQPGLCEHGSCVNTKGSFICSCGDGYRADATKQSCEDINECDESEAMCENGRCINMNGMFQCICDPGFSASADLSECIDEDECAGAADICGSGECVNMGGSFKCVCLPGFDVLPNGQGCVDVDECDKNPCANGKCENSEGSFQCICHPFLILDGTGTKCVLNPTLGTCFRDVRNGNCKKGTSLKQETTQHDCCCTVPGATSAWGDSCSPCPEKGTPDYEVLCDPRWETGDQTDPINMCNMVVEPCVNGVCINMPGNEFRCECDIGFLVSEDQQDCVDTDECDESMCSNGNCRNTPGSFSCTCDEGYVLSGDVCEDIDECNSNPCQGGECVNEAGGYRCDCDDGAVIGASGNVCYDQKKGTCWSRIEDGECSGNVGDKLMTAAECCNTVGAAWGIGATCTDCKDIELDCEKGYIMDPTTEKCTNINECELNLCEDGAACTDVEGSFICTCPEGLALNPDGISCSDVRVGSCFLAYDCDQANGRLMSKKQCCCSIGASWAEEKDDGVMGSCEKCPSQAFENEEYVDLCFDDGKHSKIGDGIIGTNQCLLFPDICGDGECKVADGGFVCECNNGFTSDENGYNCADIDECSLSPDICGTGECKNVNGDFVCECEGGYTNGPTKKCIDIDECKAGGACSGGDCINTEGGFECLCPDGRSLSDDGASCVDIDECAVQGNVCGSTGRCENMLGKFICICDPGYASSEDEQSCHDIDECLVGNGGCEHNCHNTVGGVECSCDEGYVLALDGRSCADFDECLEHMDRCNGGRCENLPGGFRCNCFDGFVPTHDMTLCEDRDECAMNPNICAHGACHNTKGSYTCLCEPGYCVPADQMLCLDEDECEMSKHNCHVNADCKNNQGSYECICIAGFHGDGFMCHDDNECDLETHSCHPDATCENRLGSYTCNCNEGFHGDGFSCSDTDDCLVDDTLCGPHGTCLNVEGSFECDCPIGFARTDDGKACKDVDECAYEANCINGRCHNVPGGFNCDCLPGFQKDEEGLDCVDIDECEEISNCINGECINEGGSYVCQCPEGFSNNPSGVGCIDERTGDCFLGVDDIDGSAMCKNPIGKDITRATCCCTGYPKGWGNPCEHCPEVNTTEYNVLCPGGPGFLLNPINVVLEDIDECVLLPGLCKGGKCINVFGHYICECPLGYTLNQETRQCEDFNECDEGATEGVDPCGTDGEAECQNSVGGFQCVCPPGWKTVDGGKRCEDERELTCHRYINETSGECSSPLFASTRKKCCCYANIGAAWGDPCSTCPAEGSDKFKSLCGSSTFLPPPTGGICVEIEALCENGICLNTATSYQCECSNGYHFDQDTIRCEDDNECVREDICMDNAECVNVPGGYNCACLEGFVFNEENNACEDKDECEEITTCTNGGCTNSIGGFICDCQQGFESINDGQACEDIDECARSPCGPGSCINSFGGFTCSCDNGYEVGDNGDCQDIDECAEAGQCENGDCENTPGGFVCICHKGYQETRDGRVCNDINECSGDNNPCGEGTCQNMDGDFKCFCPNGFLPGPDGCEDKNECEDEANTCRYGDCLNTDGGFLCSCPEGYVLSEDSKSCIDIRQSTCFNTVSFEDGAAVCGDPMKNQMTRGMCCCACADTGYENEGNCSACPVEGSSEFDYLCPYGCGVLPSGIDIDECLMSPCKNGRCSNTPGSYKCSCTRGFQLAEDGVTCVDVNECEVNPCGAGTCTNTDGSFECACDAGYYNGPAIICVDVDECASKELNSCAFRCVNSPGGFHCDCPKGFKLRDDGNMCEDIDECLSDDTNDCSDSGMLCRNMIGHFTCLCPLGYRRLGTANQCVDVNECETLRVCGNGKCVNKEGTYVCECNDNYEYDEANKVCIDTRMELCYNAVHQRMCDVTSTTHVPMTKASCCCNRGKGWGPDCETCPHPGTREFMDMCPHGMGFTPDGQDIDDCLHTPNLCASGKCINTLGSFRCSCDHGFVPGRSKQSCVDVNECVAAESPCSFDCRNTPGGYECVCPQGYQLDRDGKGCVDLDECATKAHNCQYLCVNTVGSFKCDCPRGFVKEEAACVDRDECREQPGICGGRGGLCKNDPGGYHCECPRGYRMDERRNICIDIDECGGGVSAGPCGGNCQNVPGSFRCHCGQGYAPTMFGRGCADVDECGGGRRNPCGSNQQCQNTPGSFQCGCNSGFSMESQGGGCGDVDECSLGRGSCSFGCSNTYGGFQCSCPMGFFRLGSGHCVRGGPGGFRQQIPSYGGGFGGGFGGGYGGGYQQPAQTGWTIPETRCFSCMPGGDTKRGKRSADEPEGRFVEVNDNRGRAQVNSSYPVEVEFNLADGEPHRAIFSFRPSLKQLYNNVRYAIVEGNDDGLFKIHRRGKDSVLHRASAEKKLDVGLYEMKLKGFTTLKENKIKKVAFESEVIENAIKEPVTLKLKINVVEKQKGLYFLF